MVLNSRSMLWVWLRACCFAAFSWSSISPHHFTVFSASAKSWSLTSSVLMPWKTAMACSFHSARFDAVTMPVTSMRRAGIWSGARPAATGSAAGAGS
ncbi:hypothetical protein G6F61_014729 [Rhizopus arrhizus]|nr:hypothetical protein G6F61_014729 [Rhizopus arrhizus]